MLAFFLKIYLGNFSYTSRAGFISIGGVSLTDPMLASFLSGEFLLHIPCLFYFLWVETSDYCLFIFSILGVSIIHPVLSFTCGEFLLHIPCWLYIYLVSLSYTSRAGFIFIFFLIFFSFFFFFSFLLFLNLGSFSYTSRTGFFFIWGVSLTHPMLAFCARVCVCVGGSLMWGVSLRHPIDAFFLSGEFLLHIALWLFFLFLFLM